jgi:uncharacterized membrane protein HdeD (DUF308 family)
VIGVLAIIAGIIALAWPEATALVTVLIVAIGAFADGFFSLSYGIAQVSVGIQLRTRPS